jgi:hypothetical protein
MVVARHKRLGRVIFKREYRRVAIKREPRKV